MTDSNQPPPREDARPAAPAPLSPFLASPDSSAPAAATEPATSAGLSLPRALLVWLALLAGFGVGGLFFGQQELALLAAVAGIFVAAQAADANDDWRELYFALGWVVPALGFATGIAVAMAIWQGGSPGWARGGLALFAVCGAGLAVLTTPSPVASSVARWIFREPRPGHVLRLSARCVVLTLALVVPGWFAAQQVMESLLNAPEPLMDRAGLGGGLIGYVLLAFAGVGFLIRRNFAEAARRLGLRWPGWRDLVAALLALGLLWALNTGADVLQHRFFPSLWAADKRVSEAIGSGMGPARVLLLGLSAGIGEEITLRGALQPRLGILLTSAFFAALHVQYSWFGMLVILVLGALLGIVRQRTSTSAAILAHVAYDVLAVMGN